MVVEEEIKKIKEIAGLFYTEVKSNSLSDFIIWYECKLLEDYSYKTRLKKRQ